MPRPTRKVARRTAKPRSHAKRARAVRELRILIADAQVMDRRAMAALLASQPGWKVVAEAESIAETVQLYREHDPKVIVLALGLRGANGESPVRALRAELPHASVLALSERGVANCLVLNPPGAGPARCELAVDCMQLAAVQGAQGVLRRSASAEELFEAVRVVASGRTWYETSTADALAEGPNRPGFSAAAHGLSDRELEVAELISLGRSNKDIAEQLRISEPTVKKHVGQVLLKLGCQDRLQAGLFVARHPLLLRRESTSS
jgi:NarL family two-component system response regulator LiaR